MSKYDHKTIEAKWRKKWLEEKTHQPDLEKAKKPFYNLMMFPYPSAEGLHVGNMYAFTGADVYGRYKRMKGMQVFEPIGLDGFGIHSENYAIKIGKHPVEQAKVSEKRFYDQLSKIGASYAWDYRLETYDPEYYKWTQWIVVEMFKHGLAYRGEAVVNWCPSCKTVLADEQVEGARLDLRDEVDARRVCERCKSEVERKKMEQWFFKITEYADRLLENIEKIDWPEKIKIAQRNWIGRKEGIDIVYPIKGSKEAITCFTTRPDTNFGATFVVVAPEHNFLESAQIPAEYEDKVRDYIKRSLNKTEQERKEEGREKTGVFTGLYAINQLNDYEMPIYISDFVLMDVGTGAVVGVPGHDKRDFEFAQLYDLPVIRVVVADDGDKSEITKVEQVQEKEGVMINSEFLDGLDIHEATRKMMDHIEEKEWGKRTISYHLRDWLISRQRYWGPPIPMVYCQACARKSKSWFTTDEAQSVSKSAKDWHHHGWYPEAISNLPVELPFVRDYKPKGDGKAPLENAPEEWLFTKCPECGGKAKREVDVSDTFLDSSWYFLAYPSLKSKTWKSEGNPFDPEITKKWLPVSAYIGGAEHAVLHLLYSRFVTQALKDWGHLDFEEPFPFLFSHGLIIKDGAKMSKSRGNVVIPDEYIDKYGADTLRMYLMFLGSYDQGGDFRDTGTAGMGRFLVRVWETFQDKTKVSDKTSPELVSVFHKTIKKMGEDIGKFKYNTAIAAFMELMNAWRLEKQTFSREDALVVGKLIAPFAPFMAEEVHEQLRGTRGTKSTKFESVHTQEWPEYDKKQVVEQMVTVAVQVDGRLRATIEVRNQDSGVKDEVVVKAKADERVKKWLEGKKIKKEVFVKGRLVNFVVG